MSINGETDVTIDGSIYEPNPVLCAWCKGCLKPFTYRIGLVMIVPCDIFRKDFMCLPVPLQAASVDLEQSKTFVPLIKPFSNAGGAPTFAMSLQS